MDFGKSSIIADTARALGFLTRLSIPARYFGHTPIPVSQSSRAFPLAGLVAALPAALILLIAPLSAISPLLAAVIAVALSISVCGALHEDGLADAADGFFGGRDVQSRLDIMKDSRNGTYGTLALILSVFVRVAALSSIASQGGLAAALALIASSVAARTALVWHWYELPSARPGGAADQAGKPDSSQLNFALKTGIPLFLFIAFLASNIGGAVLAASLIALSSLSFLRLCREKIGGHTGDTLGASAQIAEIVVLTALAAAI